MQMRCLALLLLGVALVLSGCVAGREYKMEMPPEPPPLGERVKAPAMLAGPEAGSGLRPGMKEPTGPLTLRQAISLTLMKNPELAAFSWEVRARDAARLQASLLPNPEVDIEMENIAGGGNMEGTDAMETTIQLRQLFELGGKRSKRERLASLERDLAGWDYEARRLDVLTGTTIAFIELLSAQERLELTEEMERIAEQVYITVSERVRAGKVSPIEETKAGVALSTSRIEVERSKRGLKAARKRLAGYWGSDTPGFERVEGDLDRLAPVPPYDVLLDRVSKNPDIARWVVEVESRRAALDLAKAGRIPDLTVSGGYRRFNEIDDNAFVVGISVPLTIFNRNQGSIAEMGHRLSKAAHEREAVQTAVQTTLSGTYQTLSTAYAEARTLKEDVLPAAHVAFEAVSEGYRLGKFNFLDVLDAQRTLFEVKEQYIDALSAYHTGVAEVERLVGAGMDETAYAGRPDTKGDGLQ